MSAKIDPHTRRTVRAIVKVLLEKHLPYHSVHQVLADAASNLQTAEEIFNS